MDILQELRDRHEIEQTVFRWCEIVDTKDFDRLHEVFTEDAVGDYSQTNGKVMNGLAPFVEHMKTNLGPESNCGVTQHNAGNFRIGLDGDRATSKANFYAVHLGVRARAGETYTCWGQYEDEWVRTPKGWRISRRFYRNYMKEGNYDVVRAHVK